MTFCSYMFFVLQSSRFFSNCYWNVSICAYRFLFPASWRHSSMRGGGQYLCQWVMSIDHGDLNNSCSSASCANSLMRGMNRSFLSFTYQIYMLDKPCSLLCAMPLPFSEMHLTFNPLNSQMMLKLRVALLSQGHFTFSFLPHTRLSLKSPERMFWIVVWPSGIIAQGRGGDMAKI